MKLRPRLDRRHYLKLSMCGGASLALGPLLVTLTSCGRDLSSLKCSAPEQLDEQSKQTRSQLGYVDLARDEGKRCLSCTYWEKAASDGCGSCSTVPGPIHPLGTCKIFRPGVG